MRAADLTQIGKAKAEGWAKSNNDMPFFETSAKEDFMVSDAFEIVARRALKQNQQEAIFLPPTATKLGKKPDPEKKKGCC